MFLGFGNFTFVPSYFRVLIKREACLANTVQVFHNLMMSTCNGQLLGCHEAF